MEAAMDVFKESLNKMDPTDLEASWKKSEAVAERQDASKEEVAVETVGALVDKYGDRHLAVERCSRGGPRAIVGPGRSWLLPKDGWPTVPFLQRARDMVFRDQAGTVLYEESLIDEHSEECRAQPGCNNDIRDWGQKEQLHLGSKRAINKTVRQTFELEVVKRVVGIPIGLPEVSDWTLWRGRPPLR
jgi:hypothetical protein